VLNELKLELSEEEIKVREIKKIEDDIREAKNSRIFSQLQRTLLMK